MAKPKLHAMNSSRCQLGTAGFTLVETLVALLIVGLGMTAVFMQLNQVAMNSGYLRDKTLASWIGSNKVTEYSLQSAWPEIDEIEEEITDFANRDWQLAIVVSETGVENLRRVDVSVALADDPDNIIHTVSGLLEPPATQLPPVEWRSVGPLGGGGPGRGGGPGPGADEGSGG